MLDTEYILMVNPNGPLLHCNQKGLSIDFGWPKELNRAERQLSSLKGASSAPETTHGCKVETKEEEAEVYQDRLACAGVRELENMTLNTQKWQLWPKYMLANVGKQGFIDLGDVSDSDVSIHVPRLSLAMVSIQPPLAI